MTNQITKPLAKERELIQLVRSELNIQKWACLFATRHFAGRSRKIVRKKENVELHAMVGIQFDGSKEIEVGVLKIPAFKVLNGLIRIWELNGKPMGVDEWVVSSLRELAYVLNRAWGKSTAESLKRSLKSLRDIPIMMKGFFSKGEGDYIEILEDQPLRFVKLKIFRRKRGGKEIDYRFKFRFDERILENLVLGYTKPYLLSVITPFSDITTLIYTHVDLVMAKREKYRRRSERLFQDLGLMEAKRYQHTRIRKQALEQAIEELITLPRGQGKAGTPLSSGTLTRMYLGRTKDGKDWNVHFVKRRFRKPAVTQDRETVEQLVQEIEGVLRVGERNRPFYTRIARRCPRDLIRMALRDTLDEERGGKITGSRAQFFGYWVQVLAFQRGLDLGLKSSFDYILQSNQQQEEGSRPLSGEPFRKDVPLR